MSFISLPCFKWKKKNWCLKMLFKYLGSWFNNYFILYDNSGQSYRAQRGFWPTITFWFWPKKSLCTPTSRGSQGIINVIKVHPLIVLLWMLWYWNRATLLAWLKSIMMGLLYSSVPGSPHSERTRTTTETLKLRHINGIQSPFIFIIYTCDISYWDKPRKPVQKHLWHILTYQTQA